MTHPSPATTPVSADATSSPPTIVIRQSDGGWWWRLLALFGWLGFGLVGVIALVQFSAYLNYFDNSHGITEKYHSGAKFASNKIAIIRIEGIIAETDGYAKGQIDRVREDDDVKAVVVRIDSPGGTVTASDYLWHHLKKLREERKLPLVVSMGGIAASGGYYVAMAVGDQEDSIFAEPTTTTGSIGVMLPHYDFSGLLERFDVKDDSLATHPRKEMTSMTKPMTEEHRALLQSYIDESLGRFKEVVYSGRPNFRNNKEALDKLATGEIFSATKAEKHGLIDKIGFLEEAIDRAKALAGLENKEVRVVDFDPPATLIDLGLFAGARHQIDSTPLQALFELSTPRAYYMVSTLPPLMSTYAGM